MIFGKVCAGQTIGRFKQDVGYVLNDVREKWCIAKGVKPPNVFPF